MKRVIILLATACATHGPLSAQDAALEAAHQELVEMNRLEQERFVSGDCDGLMQLLSEDISFYANGRKLPKAAVGQMCARIPRPFPGTGEAATNIRMLSENAGYVVKFMSFPDSDGVEVVTKVWEKVDEAWKMVHFQSTVMAAGPSGPRRPGGP